MRLSNRITVMVVTSLVAVIGLTACAVSTASRTTLNDTSPGQLDAQVTLFDGQMTANRQVGLSIAFTFRHAGTIIELHQGETILCNQTPLVNHMSSYNAFLPGDFAEHDLACVYHSPQGATQLAIHIPARPTVIAPTQDATVARGQDTRVTYVAAQAREIQAFGISATDVTLHHVSNGAVQTDNGNYAGLNTSALPAGPGTVSLLRTYAPQQIQNSGFAAVTLLEQSQSTIPVIWN